MKDAIEAYSLDANAESALFIDRVLQHEKKPMTKPTKIIDMKEAWCNPRVDDECIINGKKIPKSQLRLYLPEIYEIEVLNARGYCQHPICYDKNDTPIGIH